METYKNKNMQIILKKVISIVQECDLFYNDDYSLVKNYGNPVTSIDKSIDEYLSKNLPKLFNALYLSEENYHPSSNVWRWIVDPVDGTENLLVGSPKLATSVALVNPKGQCILGIVHAPFLKETFSAIKGGGAFFNNVQLKVKKRMGRKLISMAFPKRSKTISDIIGKQVSSFLINSWSIRASGSAALDICDVARGYCLAFNEESTYIWDVIAASLIAQEMGCKTSLTSAEINNLNPHIRHFIVAKNSEYFREIEHITKGYI